VYARSLREVLGGGAGRYARSLREVLGEVLGGGAGGGGGADCLILALRSGA
jgi:hypothetical protein